MSTRFLLDTNVVSDLIRHPQGRIAERIAEVGDAWVCTSVIVAAELRYGAERKGSPRLTAQMEAVLGAIDILPFEPPADAAYAVIRATLERAGRVVGGDDLLIAAHAVHDRHGERPRVLSHPRPRHRELAALTPQHSKFPMHRSN